MQNNPNICSKLCSNIILMQKYSQKNSKGSYFTVHTYVEVFIFTDWKAQILKY